MRAMVFDGGAPRLREAELPDPVPGAGQLLIDVHACGVCRTDLHVVDGDLRDPKRPVIPGHEIVGTVAALGAGAEGFAIGERVGVPWLGHTCGHCAYCASGRENLCDAPGFTGYTIDGGYAQRTVADARFCVHVPSRYDDIHAAPLLCAGLIGYRTLKMAGAARRIGLYGFGAAAHLVAQGARFQGRTVYAFTRAVVKGGIVVCGGIHMSDIPSFSYDLLWGERRIVSVANLTRDDAAEFMRIANDVQLDVEATPYPLAQANQALDDLRAGRLTGAAVLTMR